MEAAFVAAASRNFLLGFIASTEVEPPTEFFGSHSVSPRLLFGVKNAAEKGTMTFSPIALEHKPLNTCTCFEKWTWKSPQTPMLFKNS